MELNRSPRTHMTNAPRRRPLPVPMVLSTRSVSTLSAELTLFSVHVETAAKIARATRRAIRRFVHVSGIGANRPLLRPTFAAEAKVKRPCRPRSPAQSLSARQ